MQLRSIENVELILKLTERCNINCKYCYYFNANFDPVSNYPKKFSLSLLPELIKFLEVGINDLNIKQLSIIFHGGEPLMYPHDEFDIICQELRKSLDGKVELIFSLQSNGMLIDVRWAQLFIKHCISIGVSIDGPKNINDEFRVDFKNQGTYDRVVKGLNICKRAFFESKEFKKSAIGILCVINPKHAAKKIYSHIVHDLNCPVVDFLLPDFTHESFSDHLLQENLTVDDYKKYLLELFKLWTEENNPDVKLRFFTSTISALLGGASQHEVVGHQKNSLVFTISSNGMLAPVDTISAVSGDLMMLNCSLKKTSLADFLKHPVMEQLFNALHSLPRDCYECCWKRLCNGGTLQSRYSQKRQFDNRSVFCEPLQSFYASVSAYLLVNGVPKSKIISALS